MVYPKQDKQRAGVPAMVFSLSIIGVAILAFTFGVGLQSSGKFSDLGSKQETKNSSKLPADLDYSEVEVLYDSLKKDFDGELKKADLLEGLKTGLVSAAGDPYTVYLSEKSAAEFDESLNGKFEGIGAEIAIKDDLLQIVAPLPETPAQKAGLRAGDGILKIGDTDTQGLTVEEAVTKIRGPGGSKLQLTILRGRDVQKVELTRASITVHNAISKIIDGDIGYIELRTFGDNSASEVRKIAEDYKAKGIKKVILDVRNNGGGLLDQSVDIAGEWLDGQVVLEQRSADGNKEVFRAKRGGTLSGTELVVLINGGSASASEIVAGALQDHGVGTVLGEQSFGKGSVQTLEKLEDGGQLKVTIARWYTPKGTNIDKEGITPDKKVELTEKDFDQNLDPQLEAAKKILK
ncbi:S41 family peptidase [Candidatus Saccharibacteria bacterium]|nr:S41 family peptidase [Candidatus Saccharibacteria bacterium]